MQLDCITDSIPSVMQAHFFCMKVVRKIPEMYKETYIYNYSIPNYPCMP